MFIDSYLCTVKTNSLLLLSEVKKNDVIKVACKYCCCPPLYVAVPAVEEETNPLQGHCRH